MFTGKTLRFADKIIGSFLYQLFSIKSRIKPNQKHRNNKILAIKLWALGETVLILPGLQKLKELGYQVTLLSSNYNTKVAKLSGIFDEIIEIEPTTLWKTMKEIKKREFGIVLDFEPFSQTSAVLAYCSGASQRIGFSNRKSLYTDYVRPHEAKHAVENFCRLCFKVKQFSMPKKLPAPKTKKLKTQNAVGFHPGSASTSVSRRWPKERWIELGRQLNRAYPKLKIYVTGSENEQAICKAIASKIKNSQVKILPLEKFISLCTSLKVFIANDSGPMHLACFARCPTIGIFGPNAPERFGPYGKKCIGIRKETKKPIIRPFAGKFPEDKGKSIKKVSIEDVMKQVGKFL